MTLGTVNARRKADGDVDYWIGRVVRVCAATALFHWQWRRGTRRGSEEWQRRGESCAKSVEATCRNIHDISTLAKPEIQFYSREFARNNYCPARWLVCTKPLIHNLTLSPKFKSHVLAPWRDICSISLKMFWIQQIIEKSQIYHTILAHVRGRRDWRVEMIAGWFRSEPRKIFEIELVAIAARTRRDGQAVDAHNTAHTGTHWSK